MVVDASVVVSGLLDGGADGRWSERMLGQGELCAPELVLVETTNILRRLEQTTRISPDAAAIAMSDLLALPIELFPFAPFAGRVWELRENHTSYDAWYIAVAEMVESPLATLDRRLARAGITTCRIITPPDT